MINKKQLAALKIHIDAASSAINTLYQEIDDEGYSNKYNDASEKQQETPKGRLLAQVTEVRDFEWAERLLAISEDIDELEDAE